MPKKSCRKNNKSCCYPRDIKYCNSYQPCYYPCDINWCNQYQPQYQPQCYNYCFPVCPPPPPPPPVILTNIAVLGTGPFGIGPSIRFSVTNTTAVPAENVSVSISANQAVFPVAIVTSTGFSFNQPGTSFILWNVGLLLGGQSASITFTQMGVASQATTWTAIGSTSTPEVTQIDNTATVIVPIPG